MLYNLKIFKKYFNYMLMQCQKSSKTSWMLNVKRQMWVFSEPRVLSPRPEAPPGGSELQGSKKTEAHLPASHRKPLRTKDVANA